MSQDFAQLFLIYKGTEYWFQFFLIIIITCKGSIVVILMTISSTIMLQKIESLFEIYDSSNDKVFSLSNVVSNVSESRCK